MPSAPTSRSRALANGDGLRQALDWLTDQPAEIVRIGVEGSSGHGRHVAKRLAGAGYDVREVPTRRTAERRRAHRRAKSDHEDALAIARATAGEPGLGPTKQAGIQERVALSLLILEVPASQPAHQTPRRVILATLADEEPVCPASGSAECVRSA